MKNFNKIIVVVLLAAVVILLGANLYGRYAVNSQEGRPYRVEISRLVREIEETGMESIDLSGCRYVTHVEMHGGSPSFYNGDSDYLVREINGTLYRFDYSGGTGSERGMIWVNFALGCMALLVIAVLFYVRQKIIVPFEKLAEVPYELSKGNLTVPVQESKSRYFGRFVWGVDLLRENIEEQKQRELGMQKEKKTLLLSLSHDIKTPLSAIKLYAQALSRGLYTDREKQKEIANSINAKADEIEGFVSQITRASSEDLLSLVVNNDEFYLSELMEKIVGYYREKLALVQIDVSVGAYSNCLIKGDLDRSVEVLQNIIENAVKYGDGRSIALRVSEEEGCQLIAVRNSGCTLPETELPHIFDSFWRGSNAGGQKGSGLGLYICRQLMNKMGGEIFANAGNGFMTVTAVFQKA